MKHLLATLSVVALIALPGCCKNDRCSKPKTEQCKDKKATCSKDMKKDDKKKGCKSCKDDKKKPAYSKQSYLELEPAEDLLI